jgi:hypothetical protein
VAHICTYIWIVVKYLGLLSSYVFQRGYNISLDVIHNEKERAQSTKGLVESNAHLFTTKVESKDMLNEYFKVFKEQVDTIEAHSNHPGYHRALF